MKIAYACALVALIAGHAWGWTGDASQGLNPLFVQQPGTHEFSGRMIARPKQIQDLVAKGVRFDLALAIHSNARRQVVPIMRDYVPETDEFLIDVPFGSSESRLARQLLASGSFEYIEPDWIVYPTFETPNDPRYPQQWHLPKIRAPHSWSLFKGNNKVTIAIVDTGVRLDHEDLAPLLVPGYNSASRISQADGGLVDDINGHGTHCAGIAAAYTDNAKGVAGVGWQFKIMPIRASNQTSGSASISNLTAGARWAADNGARVISTSYSGVSSSSVQTTGNYIKHQRNGIYVWAAGNSNTNLSTFDHVDVTIVGATDQNDNKASFSSYGLALDIFAPGVGIVSTYNRSPTDYASLSGTSMATPCAAGVAGMIMATNPTLTGEQVETLLYQTCDDLGSPGQGYWGWGRVNVEKGIRKSYEEFPFLIDEHSIVEGQLVSGSGDDLNAANGQYLTVVPLPQQTQMMLEYEGNTTLLKVGTLVFNYECKSNTVGATVTIELFDYVAGQYVQVLHQNTATSNQRLIVQPTSPQRFVQTATGNMKSRATYNFTGLLRSDYVNWTAMIDHVSWQTLP